MGVGCWYGEGGTAVLFFGIWSLEFGRYPGAYRTFHEMMAAFLLYFCCSVNGSRDLCSLSLRANTQLKTSLPSSTCL